MAARLFDTKYVTQQRVDRELKKGSAELLILSLVESRARHGYEIGKLIETRSKGMLSFQVASLYPLLYRLEARGVIEGRWVEKAGQRRRRYYRLTAEGRKALATQRQGWRQFVEAIRRITEVDYA
jgi:transcriptional regulator